MPDSVIRRCMQGIGLLAFACAAQAADVATQGGVAVSDADMRAALASVAPSQREQFSRSENSARNLATDLVVRRVIAERARKDGLTDDPEIARRLRLIEERALYEMFMERAERAALSPEALEGLARDDYRAFPERFRRDDSVRARHILVPFGEDKDAARARAEELLARLKAGEAFDKLAERESADPGSAARGGDLGFFARGKMVKPFEDAAFALETPGQLSDIVESQFGFHIIRFEEKQPAGVIPYEEVREALVEAARRKRAGDVRREILAPLREDGALSFDAEALRNAVGGNW